MAKKIVIKCSLKKKKQDPVDNNLVFRKLRQTASTASANNNQVQFGLPRQSQIIWPGKSIRLCTGWNVQVMPKGSQMTTSPHKQLLANNLVSIPQTLDYSQAGAQLSQVVLNNGTQPVKIVVLNLEDQPKLVRLHPQTLEVTQQLQFNFTNFLSGVITAGTQIATLFA